MNSEGYDWMGRIPPEYARHNCTWMAWPWDEKIWNAIPGTCLAKAQEALDRLIRTVAKYENVSLLVPGERSKELARRFEDSENKKFSVKIIAAEYNDIWVRDTLPTFAVDNARSLVAINWNFNGWGRRISKYGRYGHDATLAQGVAKMIGARLVDSEVVAEGGAFAFDGCGTIVATKSVMFDHYRKPGRNLDSVSKALQKASCCDVVCWLPGDSNEPITTGHADALLSFATGKTVLFHWIDDETNPEYSVCDYNLRVFQDWAESEGRDYDIVRLSTPNHKRGDLYCASYVNFAHVNGAVIVPKHGSEFDEADRNAEEKICKAFQNKLKVEMIDVRALAAAGGGIHCLTQQEPLVSAFDPKECVP